jgi:hypothetical protein
MKPIYTIQSWPNGYYFDLLENLKFSVSFHEKTIFVSEDPCECVKVLKLRGCECNYLTEVLEHEEA